MRSKLSPIRKPGVASSATSGFFRRSGAIFYDTLLLLAVWFLATAVALPINGGQAFSSRHFLYPVYLLAVSFLFFAWFWTHGGQTLGMRAWKIRVSNRVGGDIGWRQALIRFVVAGISWACLGLGFIWCLFDRDGLCWHDRLSATVLERVDGENGGLEK